MMKQSNKKWILFLILTAAVRNVNAQEITRITMQSMKVVYVKDTAVTIENFLQKWEKGMVYYLH
jgi:hypothetical protein